MSKARKTTQRKTAKRTARPDVPVRWGPETTAGRKIKRTATTPSVPLDVIVSAVAKVSAGE